MSEDSPKIVSLETSLELSEFPSEAELTPEAGTQVDGGWPPAVVTLSQAPHPLPAEIALGCRRPRRTDAFRSGSARARGRRGCSRT